MKSEKKAPAVAPLTWKQRVTALRNLPRFFRLVWQASPGIMIANSLLRIIRSAIPVAILYVGKLIIDSVVVLARTGTGHAATATGTGLTGHGTGIFGHGSGLFSHPAGDIHSLWQLVALEFGLALLSDALMRAIMLMDSLLGDRFSNLTSIRIMRHAARLDLDQFEDSTFYDKL